MIQEKSLKQELAEASQDFSKTFSFESAINIVGLTYKSLYGINPYKKREVEGLSGREDFLANLDNHDCHLSPEDSCDCAQPY